MFENATARKILTDMGKAFLLQQAHDAVRPIIRAALARHPELSPDTLPKWLVVQVVSALPGVFPAAFPEHKNLVYFAEVLVREAICELKVHAKEHPPAAPGNEGAIDVAFTPLDGDGLPVVRPSAGTGSQVLKRLRIWGREQGEKARRRTTERNEARATKRKADELRRAQMGFWTKFWNLVLGRGW